MKIKNKYIPLLKVVIPQQNKLKKSIWHDLLTSDDLVETLKKQELSKSKNLINDLENAKNDLFAKLMRALIFSLRSNDARANAELLDILSFHPLEYSFNRYLDHDHEILETQALRIMIQLSKNPEIKDIVSIVAIYLANNLTSEFATKLSFHFDTNLSSSELTERTHSSNLGLKLVGIWFPLVWERQGLNKAEAFLEKSLKFFPEHIKNYPWIFYDFFPANKDIREKVLENAIMPLVKNENQIAQFRKLNFAENMFVKKWLEEKEKRKSPPLFKLKRDFFQGLLKEQIATDLALYHLFMMGDYDINYFQWIR